MDALNSNSEETNEEVIITNAIRSQSMICLDGELDMNRIMSGDFSALRRSDCAFRFNDVFRWAWESWRAAVGNRIGQNYPYAVQLMNIGARNNGEKKYKKNDYFSPQRRNGRNNVGQLFV